MKVIDTKTAIALRPLLAGLISDYSNLWEGGSPMGQVVIDGDMEDEHLKYFMKVAEDSGDTLGHLIGQILLTYEVHQRFSLYTQSFTNAETVA